MLLPPIKQLPKDNPAKAVCDANDAEEKAALGLAHAPKLYRTVSGEGVEGANADVVEEVTEKVEHMRERSREMKERAKETAELTAKEVTERVKANATLHAAED